MNSLIAQTLILFSTQKKRLRCIGIGILIYCIGLNGVSGQSFSEVEKIRGVSFSSLSTPGLHPEIFEDIKKVNAEWVTFVPEAVINRSTLELRPDSDNHFWGRTIKGTVAGMKLAKEAGLKIMLKPQILLDNYSRVSGTFNNLIKLEDLGGEIVVDNSDAASWRGDFNPGSDEGWKKWEESYKQYILRLAEIAEQMHVEIFCIGTELKKSSRKRPQFWIELIAAVRQVYSGSVIYSANCDEYKRIKFWKHLDYIGVNAYFPISLLPTPTVKGSQRNWKFFKKKLKKFSKKLDKPIIITEFGYRNVSFAGLRPWIHDDGESEPNDIAQENLYEAFFKAFWDEKWILGGFSWNWDAIAKAEGNTDFSVQNKPAQKILSHWFRR